MAFSKMVKPETTELLPLEVLRSERLAPHWMRVTLGGGEIDRFRPMGYDQWFRLFIPVGGDAGLERVPAKAHKLFGYLRFLRIPDGVSVQWLVRPNDVEPGSLALATLRGLTLPDAPFHTYAASEQALASGVRKQLVSERSVDRNTVSFCGYWKIGAASPTSKTAREIAAEPLV